MAKLFFSISLFAFVGCTLHRVSHYSRDLSLSPAHEAGIGGQHKLRLIDIGQDGTTTIELSWTRERLTAKPGEFFVSDAFGTHGLELVSASSGTGQAFLKQRWAVAK